MNGDWDRTVNKERLLKLAEFLETVPADRFDLTEWQSSPTAAGRKVTKDRACGFAGCALGWAAHAGLFEGLTLTPISDELSRSSIRYHTAHGWAAPCRLFRIKDEESEYLFKPEFYDTQPSPKDVAARIRSFAGEDSSAASAPPRDASSCPSW